MLLLVKYSECIALAGADWKHLLTDGHAVGKVVKTVSHNHHPSHGGHGSWQLKLLITSVIMTGNDNFYLDEASKIISVLLIRKALSKALL